MAFCENNCEVFWGLRGRVGIKQLHGLMCCRFRTHGNELWEFDENGLMRRRDMSANDVPIKESERRYFANA